MHFFLFFIALVPALLFSQAPEFMQQYSQRLGGTADELARVVRPFEQISRRAGYEPQAGIALMENNPEQFIRDQAAQWKENFIRLSRLQAHQEVFRNGNAFARLASFATHYDPELFESTWHR